MRILFSCTHNRCRSRMAEAIARDLLPGVEVLSVGTEPAPEIDRRARMALLEIGLDEEGPGRSVADLDLSTFDLIVTLCGSADACVWLPPEFASRRRHVPVEDPSALCFGMKDDAAMPVYRRTREKIVRLCEALGREFGVGASARTN